MVSINKCGLTKLFVVFSFMLTTCSLMALPSWYQNPLRFYNPDHFIVGIGVGDDYEIALSVARAEVVNQISVTVRTDTDLSFLSTETESQAYYSEFLNRNIRTFSEQQIQGMEIMQQEEFQNKFYVMVALNKLRMFTNMENAMNNTLRDIKNNLNRIEQLKERGHIVMALETYSDIQMSLTDFYSQKILYDSLSPIAFVATDMITGNEVENRVRDLISSIRFEVLSGNQQSARRGTILPEAIVFNSSIRLHSGEKVNISNLPVRLYYGDEILIETGFTNDFGDYHVYALAHPDQGERGRVIIQINPIGFPNFYTRHTRNVSGLAHFRTTESVSMQIQLSVKDSSGRNLQSSQRQISRILSNNNIILRDQAPLFIDGTVSIKDLRTVDGFGASRFLADAIIDLEFGISSSGMVLGTIQGSGRGLSEMSENDAIERAYNNISINTRDLNQLINRAETHLSSYLETESLQNLENGKRLYSAGNYRAAIEALLKVNYREEYIEEAIELLKLIRER